MEIEREKHFHAEHFIQTERTRAWNMGPWIVECWTTESKKLSLLSMENCKIFTFNVWFTRCVFFPFMVLTVVQLLLCDCWSIDYENSVFLSTCTLLTFDSITNFDIKFMWDFTICITSLTLFVHYHLQIEGTSNSMAFAPKRILSRETKEDEEKKLMRK